MSHEKAPIGLDEMKCGVAAFGWRQRLGMKFELVVSPLFCPRHRVFLVRPPSTSSTP